MLGHAGVALYVAVIGSFNLTVWITTLTAFIWEISSSRKRILSLLRATTVIESQLARERDGFASRELTRVSILDERRLMTSSLFLECVDGPAQFRLNSNGRLACVTTTDYKYTDNLQCQCGVNWAMPPLGALTCSWKTANACQIYCHMQEGVFPGMVFWRGRHNAELRLESALNVRSINEIIRNISVHDGP